MIHFKELLKLLNNKKFINEDIIEQLNSWKKIPGWTPKKCSISWTPLAGELFFCDVSDRISFPLRASLIPLQASLWAPIIGVLDEDIWRQRCNHGCSPCMYWYIFFGKVYTSDYLWLPVCLHLGTWTLRICLDTSSILVCRYFRISMDIQDIFWAVWGTYPCKISVWICTEVSKHMMHIHWDICTYPITYPNDSCLLYIRVIHIKI